MPSRLNDRCYAGEPSGASVPLVKPTIRHTPIRHMQAWGRDEARRAGSILPALQELVNREGRCITKVYG